MASLVTALCADHAAAASGTAEFYSMGTATLSSLVYSDANGLTAVTSTTLDAYGSAVRYVGEPVDVVIKAVGGSTVLVFTHIDDARVVRLESDAFTGPNTSGNGQIVAGGRTTEAAAWTLLGASLDATDGDVDQDGTITTISTAVGLVVKVFNVVKYGADKTGANDAGAGITLAIAACAAAGGGWVYFPAGTYKITSAITITSANVRICGDGRGSTTIKNYSTSGNCISTSFGGVATDSHVVVRDLSLTANTTSSGKGISLADARFALVEDVDIAKHSTGVRLFSTAATSLYTDINRVYISLAGVAAGGGQMAVEIASNNRHVKVTNCRAVGGSASGNDVGFRTGSIYTTFAYCHADSMATGTGVGFDMQSGGAESPQYCTLIGCTGTGNDTDLTANSAATGLVRYGCQFTTIADTSTAIQTQSNALSAVADTVTPTLLPLSTDCSYRIEITTSYAVGAPTVTIASPTGLANIVLGTIVEFCISKTGANQVNLTWNAVYQSDDQTAFAGLASVASGNQAAARFQVVSGPALRCVSVSATVAM